MRIKAAIVGALLALGIFGGTQATAQEVCVSAHVFVFIGGVTEEPVDETFEECLPPEG